MNQKSLIELLAVLAFSAPAVAATTHHASLPSDAGYPLKIAAAGMDGGMLTPDRKASGSGALAEAETPDGGY
jgi:hypothetical protein